MSQDVAIRVGGVWMHEVVGRYGGWADPVFSWRYPLGCWEASWKMWIRGGKKQALVSGASVEMFVGASQLWAGSLPEVELAEDDDGAVSVTATGACRDAEGTAALSSLGMTTSVPRAAALAAIARGSVNWRDVSALPATAFTGVTPSDSVDDTDAVNYLGALLDAYALEVDKAWGVDGHRDAYWSTDPTTPTYHVRPSTAVLGITSEATVGQLFGRYVSTTGGLVTATAGTGTPERLLDMTPLGRITGAKATTKLTSLSRRFGAVTGWKNGVTVTPQQIATPGGVGPHLGVVGSQVGSGLMVRMLGQRDPRDPSVSHIDVVVGEATWTPSENTLQLNPTDLASDDFSSVVEGLGLKLVS